MIEELMPTYRRAGISLADNARLELEDLAAKHARKLKYKLGVPRESLKDQTYLAFKNKTMIFRKLSGRGIALPKEKIEEIVEREDSIERKEIAHRYLDSLIGSNDEAYLVAHRFRKEYNLDSGVKLNRSFSIADRERFKKYLLEEFISDFLETDGKTNLTELCRKKGNVSTSTFRRYATEEFGSMNRFKEIALEKLSIKKYKGIRLKNEKYPSIRQFAVQTGIQRSVLVSAAKREVGSVGKLKKTLRRNSEDIYKLNPPEHSIFSIRKKGREIRAKKRKSLAKKVAVAASIGIIALLSSLPLLRKEKPTQNHIPKHLAQASQN